MPTDIKQEMQKEYEKWRDYSDKRMHWYEDKRLILVERQSQQISLVSSIAAAILTIIVIFKDKNNCWVQISFWSLLINVILGIVLSIWLRIFDEKVRSNNRIEERLAFSRLIKAAQRGINTPTDENKNKYYEIGQNIREELEKSTGKFFGEQKILEFLWVVFILMFLGSVIGLAGVWLNKV